MQQIDNKVALKRLYYIENNPHVITGTYTRNELIAIGRAYCDIQRYDLAHEVFNLIFEGDRNND